MQVQVPRGAEGNSCNLTLDFARKTVYNALVNADGLVAQLGAHHIRIVGVGSSNLLKSTIF